MEAIYIIMQRGAQMGTPFRLATSWPRPCVSPFREQMPHHRAVLHRRGVEGPDLETCFQTSGP